MFFAKSRKGLDERLQPSDLEIAPKESRWLGLDATYS